MRFAALGSILGKNIIIIEKTIQVIPLGVQPAKKKQYYIMQFSMK